MTDLLPHPRRHTAFSVIVRAAVAFFIICFTPWLLSASGQAWLETLDQSGAGRILEKAAAGDAEAQYKAGVIYNKGVGFKKDLTQAARFFLASAKGGYVEAMQNIGVMYIRGEGVPRDFIEGLKWFKRAADRGDVFAMHSLGLRYENGEGVLQDYRRALAYYTQAAQSGFPPAQYALGMMYFEGKGIAQDFSAAVTWTLKSADAGYPAAMYNMGVAYETGQGVKRDLIEAHKYLNLCVALSDRERQEAMIQTRRDIERSMSQRDIAVAQDRARTWLREHPNVSRTD